VVALGDLDVLIVDCQATGATPALGALLEVGWTTARAGRAAAPVTCHRVALPPGESIPRMVSRITGIENGDLADAIAPDDAWRRLRAASPSAGKAAPTVIHFARFELAFLRDLHARFDPESPFPFEIVCAHEIARRVLPDLPRRGLRALAGYFGHGLKLERRSAGHVEATAQVWQHLAAELSAKGVESWSELLTWLEAPAPASTNRRAYPMPRARRLSLPDAPGVYRMLRSNGDVLYVGKAASLRKRVSSHFTHGARTGERALEMLTQARDLDFTPTATPLEAALLECDEIKRHDPPYNVQLRQQDRLAWFASRDLAHAAPQPDADHGLGPLPSRHALSPLAAARALVSGAPPTAALRGRSLRVPPPFAPEEQVFAAGWASFADRHLAPVRSRTSWGALLKASCALVQQGIVEEDDEDADAPQGWDEDRVRRHLERGIASGAQLLRRARWLCLLGDCSVAWREPGADVRRVVVVAGAEIAAARDLDPDEPLPASPGAGRAWRDRQRSFDAARYDRMRVLATELKRVLAMGGTVAIRVDARHVLEGAALARLVRGV